MRSKNVWGLIFGGLMMAVTAGLASADTLSYSTTGTFGQDMADVSLVTASGNTLTSTTGDSYIEFNGVNLTNVTGNGFMQPAGTINEPTSNLQVNLGSFTIANPDNSTLGAFSGAQFTLAISQTSPIGGSSIPPSLTGSVSGNIDVYDPGTGIDQLKIVFTSLTLAFGPQGDLYTTYTLRNASPYLITLQASNTPQTTAINAFFNYGTLDNNHNILIGMPTPPASWGGLCLLGVLALAKFRRFLPVVG